MDDHVYGNWSRPEVLDLAPPGAASLLDIGCSRGDFLEEFARSRGWDGSTTSDFWGVEPNTAAANETAARGLTVDCGTFPEHCTAPLSSFDVVTFNDVLEHVIEPAVLLESAKPYLTRNGVVMASIPNVRHHSVLRQLIIGGDFRYVDAGILDRTHLRFFTRSSIVRLFEETKFRVEAVDAINRPTSGKSAMLARLVSRHISDEFFAQQFVVRAAPIA